MRIILDAKYAKADFKKVMTEQYQHLRPSKRESILNLLTIFEDFFDGTLGT